MNRNLFLLLCWGNFLSVLSFLRMLYAAFHSRSIIKQTPSAENKRFLRSFVLMTLLRGFNSLSIVNLNKNSSLLFFFCYSMDNFNLTKRSATHLYLATSKVHQSMTWYSPTRFSGSYLSHYHYLQCWMSVVIIRFCFHIFSHKTKRKKVWMISHENCDGWTLR